MYRKNPGRTDGWNNQDIKNRVYDLFIQINSRALFCIELVKSSGEKGLSKII